MGGTCSAPTISEDDLTVQGHKVSKREIQKATQLSIIPETEVVICTSGGEEQHVRSGSFVLAKLEEPKKLTLIFVGENAENMSDGFFYPLLPETPVLLSGGRVLTVHAGDGDVFGIRLPAELQGGEGALEELVKALSQECTLQVQKEPDFADRVAGHITKGGHTLVSGVEWVGNHISNGIRSGGQLARSKVPKRAEEMQVSESAKVGVTGARLVSGGAVAVSSAVVDGLMDLALVVGQEVGSLAGNTNNVDAVNTINEVQEEGAVRRVGRAAGIAGLQVFTALIAAGDRIVDETVDETSAIVNHRYGQEAGDVARDGLEVVRDVNKVKNVIGKKAVIRIGQKAALYTARGMVEGAVTNGAVASSSRAIAATSTPGKDVKEA